MSSKEREKYEKEQAKEKQEIKKMSPKEREKYEKERETKEEEKRRAERTPSDTGISIRETKRKGEKVIVVENGPTSYSTTGRVPRVGSVECVTRTEFELLEAAVNKLKLIAGPLPMLAMPDNRRLLDDIVKGSATLPDTMEAMQMAARLQAAEAAIERMAGLLTQLAASGALPQDVVREIGAVTSGLGGALGDDISTIYASGAGASSLKARKSVGIDAATKKQDGEIRRRSRAASTFGTLHVTKADLERTIGALTENMKSHMASAMAKSQANCDSAVTTATAIEDKMSQAIKLNGRLNILTSLVNDYSQQLQGFDTGLVTQLAGFHDQMKLLRKDLTGGLTLLEKANNNAESEALTELNERYVTLVNELESTVNYHGNLNMVQNQLGEELRSLVEAVEILREEKSDRDEVLDGLRDKADSSRLEELLSDQAFAEGRHQLEARLKLCYDKFNKQDHVWMDAIRDLSDISSQKAELIMLLAAQANVQTQLQEIQERLAQLALVLGEPMAAVVTRLVSKDATCGPCGVPALQGAKEPSFGKPPVLPQARPAPLGQGEPCTKDFRLPCPPDDRLHSCSRWVGGSHTLVTSSVRRVKAPAALAERPGPPVKIYPGLGTDGRLYVMETEMVPCEDCNECCRERLPNKEPLHTTHVEVCLRDDDDKKTTDEGPMPRDGAGDTAGYIGY